MVSRDARETTSCTQSWEASVDVGDQVSGLPAEDAHVAATIPGQKAPAQAAETGTFMASVYPSATLPVIVGISLVVPSLNTLSVASDTRA